MIWQLRDAWLLGLATWMLAWAGLCGPAQAAPRSLVLSPANMLAETHSHSMMLTFTSTYKRLSGVLNFDTQARTCNIDVHFMVRSLTAPNALLRSQSMSKTFLDPVDFPDTHYVGMCQGDLLVGSLTLRGQTHPFNMALTYSGAPGQLVAVHAEGILDRYDWGVTGLRLAVGKNIRITNDISLNGQAPELSQSGS